MITKDSSNDSKLTDQAYKESSKFKNLPFNCSDNTSSSSNSEKNILHDLWLTCKSLCYGHEDQTSLKFILLF
jgi:hypothetical protein